MLNRPACAASAHPPLPKSRSIRSSVLALQQENRQKAASHNIECETKAGPPLGHSRVVNDSMMEQIKNSVSYKCSNYCPKAAFETNHRGQLRNSSSRNLLHQVPSILWSGIVIRPKFNRSHDSSILNCEERNNPRPLDSIGHGHVANRPMFVAY